MNCPKCGYQNPDQSLYCSMCHEVLNKVAPNQIPNVYTSRYRPAKKRVSRMPLLIPVSVCLFIAGYFLINHLQDRALDVYDLTEDPVLTDLEPAQGIPPQEKAVWEIPYKKDTYRVEVTPLFTYDIQAKVVSVRRWKSWEEADSPVWKEIFPVDFALVWGKVADEEYAKYMKFYHTPASRFVHWKYRFPEGGPFLAEKYMLRHISNNHLCPANDTIDYALKKVRKGDFVRIKGWLMELGLYRNNTLMYTARSSTNRDDTWGGACESVYVQTLQVNDKLYR